MGSYDQMLNIGIFKMALYFLNSQLREKIIINVAIKETSHPELWHFSDGMDSGYRTAIHNFTPKTLYLRQIEKNKKPDQTGLGEAAPMSWHMVCLFELLS